MTWRAISARPYSFVTGTLAASDPVSGGGGSGALERCGPTAEVEEVGHASGAYIRPLLSST